MSLAFLVAGANAQSPRFERYSTPDGLSNHAVTAVLQDSRGFLWVGTYDGLNRYDGVSFKRFPVGDQYFTDDAVQPGALLEYGGGLWVGTGNGLHRIDFGSNRVDRFLDERVGAPTKGGNIIMSLAVSDSATLWIGTANGLWRFDLLAGTLVRHELDTDTTRGLPYVFALHTDAAGVVWAGTGKGLLRYDARADQFLPVETPEPLPLLPVTAIQTMADGALWYSNLGGGVVRLDVATGRWAYLRRPRAGISMMDYRVYDIAQDRGGTVWITSWEEGVCAYGGVAEAWTCSRHDPVDPHSLSDNQTTSLLVDRSGELFVGTWNGLSKRQSPKAFRVYTADHEAPGLHLSHHRVNAIHEARDGGLWVGLYGEGLDRLDREAGTRSHFEGRPEQDSLSSNEVWSITEDTAGHIWIGTGGGGVNRFDPERRAFRRYLPAEKDSTSLPDALVYTVFQDSRQRLWVGTVTRGLARYDPIGDDFVTYPQFAGPPAGPSHYSVWPILEDRKGDLWIGTVGGGINRFLADEDRFERIPSVPDLPVQAARYKVVSMTEANDGSIWAATTGHGAVRVDPETGMTTAYTTVDSLAHTSVACVLPGEGRDVWVATASGLSVFDGDKRAFTRTYTASDGLPDAAFLDGACHRSRRGELFFGTQNGLVAFYPTEIQDNLTPPLMAITGFDLFGKPHAVDETGETAGSVRLKHDQNEITFHFAGLEFTSPGDNRFAYYLEGADAGWVHTTSAFARYPELNPGRYTFRVKGANGDGVWSDEHAKMSITILPPFFWRWWVQLVFWPSVVLLVLWWSRRELNSKLKTEQLERRVESEREASRQDMVKVLHDRVGGELSAVVLRLEYLARSEQIGDDIRQNMREVWASVRNVSAYFRDATWAIDPGKDRLVHLVDRLEDHVYSLFPEGNASFVRPDFIPDLPLASREREHVYTIGVLAVTNVQNHANAARVEVFFGIEAGILTLLVRDDGKGFVPADVVGGYGIRHMRERAAAIGADIDVSTALGMGTTVTVRWRIT